MGYHGGNFLTANLDVAYEYAGREYDDWGSIMSILKINFEFAGDLSTRKTKMKPIMEQAKRYAKSLVKDTHNKYKTGRLYNSIEAKPIGNNRWTLRAPAYDPPTPRGRKRGSYYAGHIEYGFTDQSGEFRGPWPFLRPAVQMAAAQSRGMLADDLANAILYGPNLDSVLTRNQGYAGKIAFGRSSINSGDGMNLLSLMASRYSGGMSEYMTGASWHDAVNGFGVGNSLSSNSMYDNWHYGALSDDSLW